MLDRPTVERVAGDRPGPRREDLRDIPANRLDDLLAFVRTIRSRLTA